MVMARNDSFLNWVIIALLALVALPAMYYYEFLLLAKFYKPILVAVFVFIMIDLFILGPRREHEARERKQELLEKLKREK